WLVRSLCIAVALVSSLRTTDAAEVAYTVDLIAPQTQMIDLSMQLTGVERDAIELMLPVWRPGRYVGLDPAGTLQEFSVTDDTGRPLPWKKTNTSTWRIDTRHAHTIIARWRIWANSIADRTRHVDDSHAFLSPSSIFLYAPDWRDAPIRIRINAPFGWDIASGLEPAADDDRTLLAPDYDVLVDSPIEIGLHDRLTFDVEGVPHEIIIWGEADYDGEQLKTDFAKIVASQKAIFGAFPYTRYVFLLHVGAGGGGTEHLNSTIMQTRRSSLEDPAAYKRFLALVAHEFFHTWNVKQLRPACIHPYDYQAENPCELFWVAEGTTSYYDDLTLARTGVITVEAYLKMLSSSVNSMYARPGRAVQSLEESSFDAWIKFNRSNAHSANATVSFYSQGALVSWLLDCHLRRETDDRISLDDLMRTMYERFPLDGPGYTTDDLLATAQELSGMDFTAFHERYIAGVEPLQFDEPLSALGLELIFKPTKNDEGDDEDDDDSGDADEESLDVDGAHAGDADADAMPMRAFLGVNLKSSGGRTIVSSVRSDGPAFLAGLTADDEIIALDGRRLGAG
ncbi:MAG: M61 family metallopeptidase, partial [Phycisphaerales bacterium]|nr:M61 family metallopeptidase [Phycisphaerales bacterium]